MKRGAVSITIIYFLLGFLWIFMSDLLLANMAWQKEEFMAVQLTKGGLYVLITSLLLYYLIKRHSKKIVQREAHLSSLLDSQSNFLIRVDLQGNYTFANKAFCQKYSYQERELLGKSYVEYVVPEDHEKVKHMLEACISNPGRVVPLKVQRCDRAGKRFTTHWEFVAITNTKGSVMELQGVGQDVTQETEYYKQLTETKERLEHILSTIHDVVWSASADDLSILFISPACEEVYGYSQQEFYRNNHLWMDAIHADDQDQVKQALTQLFDSREREGEFRIIHKDGSIRYIYKKAILIEDKDGNPVINGVCSDITPKKLAEAQEKENTRIKEEILESITDAFFAVDKSWNFTYLNKEAERMLNVKKEAVLGQNVWNCFPEAKKLKFYAEYQRAMQQQTSVKFEEYYPPLKVWFRVAAYPTAEGLAVYFQNITQEKELEMVAEKSEQNLLALINNTEDIIWSVDADLKLLFANPAFMGTVKKQTGRTIEKGNKAFKFTIEEKESEQWKQYYQRALQGEQFRIINHNISSAREESYVEASINPIISKGKVIGVSCIARDITERKKNEDRIRHQNQMLREIAHIQSHGLRRPVATMMGLAALFDENDLSSGFNVEVIHKIKIVCQELDNIIHTIVEKTIDLE